MENTNEAITTKRCPFCAEEILSVAVKCKHCGSNLASEQKTSNNTDGTLGNIAFVLPICSAFVMLAMPGIVNLIVWLTIIATIVLITMEAHKVGAGSETDIDSKGKKREGPALWLVCGILLWIGAYPAWMHRRSKYGLKNLLWPALLGTLLFLVMAACISNVT